ncbi:MAG: enoyl-CoA hydratase/isomerase family protein [Candidatus Obscuribacterales bacterium]|nr:enoyl-CoA hydratase/isomerase family protein [Candidatus Obscuribacterales bacterium]
MSSDTPDKEPPKESGETAPKEAQEQIEGSPTVEPKPETPLSNSDSQESIPSTTSSVLPENEKASATVSTTKSDRDMTLDIADTGVATITIDMPESKVNTLGKRSMTQLNELIEQVKTNRSIRGLVFSSGKKDSFIAGADVKEIQQIQDRSIKEAYEAVKMGKEIFQKIADMPINTVAAINGICLGGGAELTLACRYRVASTKAKIGLPEIKLGFVPGWGGCVRLPKLIGVAKALDLIMAGKVVNADKALKLGLIHELVEPDQLLPRAKAIALNGTAASKPPVKLQEKLQTLLLESNPIGLQIMRDIAYKGMMAQTKGKYPAPKEALDVIIKSQSLPADKAFDLESQVFARLAMGPVSRNLVGIFFAQQDSKKLPAEISDQKEIKTVAVLGAGVMGAGIAQAAAKAGYKVIVKDIKPEFVQKGKQTVTNLFSKLVEKGRMKQAEMDRIMSEMVFTTEYAPLAECDLVIEAVLEDIEAKRQVLKEVESVINKDFVFGSNTSSLSIDAMAETARKPEHVVGIHFFNPVHQMPLVEIVKGKNTSAETVSQAMSFALELDKTTVITTDSPGFIVNRILAPYMREAAVLAGEGVPIEDIDKAMKTFGMPMGPMTLLDEVGLDIAGKVIHVMHAALGDRMSEPPLMASIEKLKLLGKKGGKGIYLYSEKKKKGKPSMIVNPDVQAAIKAPAKKIQRSQIQDRLVLLMLNEAVRLLEEGVVSDPAQLDLALIFGTGFPPFEGGILRYADSQGVRTIFDKMALLAKVEGERYMPADLLKMKAGRRERFYDQLASPSPLQATSPSTEQVQAVTTSTPATAP